MNVKFSGGGRIKLLLKIFNECKMNVKFNGGGTFVFPNTFVDLPKTRRVWAKRGVCAKCYHDIMGLCM